jgi:Zn-dependent protease
MPILNNFIGQLPSMLISLPAVLLALSFHEMCHAFVAYKLGDPTARNLGRMTLNPAKHFDPIGFLCMVLFRFGWASPVPINTRNFKNPRRDMAISAAAGPLSNVLLAIVSAGVLRLLLFLTGKFFEDDIILYVMQGASAVSTGFIIMVILDLMVFFCVLLNITYAIFNMLPVPPWDGSRVFYVFLPPKWYFGIMKHERTIMIVMILLLWTGFLTGPLSSLTNRAAVGLLELFGVRRGTEANLILNIILEFFNSVA